MAKKKKEEVVENTTEETKEDNLKELPSLKKTNKDDNITKVDLTKKEETKTEEEPAVENTEETTIEEVVEETTEDTVEESNKESVEESPTIEEITDETEEVQNEEPLEEEEKESKQEFPENIQKLMNFMEETGGDLEDYIKLNQDYSKLDDNDLLKAYYKQTKPHLTSEEIDFLMEDRFSYDEDVDEERDIKRKKLALKEQVAEARLRLDSEKSKYYEDIKYGSKLTGEQQKAIDFFNRYNKESEENKQVLKKQADTFQRKTNNVFNEKFKGFEYNIGDKKFRYNVKNTGELKETQSDINNFVKKFLNKDNIIEDAKGYHKSIFTAMNSDAIASHFYEQGKVDGLKESIAKSKNISMDPRKQHEKAVNTSGVKFRALGNNSDDFKFKIKQK